MSNRARVPGTLGVVVLSLAALVPAACASAGGGPGAAEPWPWPDLAPADFAQPADDAAVPFPTRLLTAAQAETARSAGGTAATGAPGTAHGPDGRDYLLLLRQALPDELAGG